MAVTYSLSGNTKAKSIKKKKKKNPLTSKVGRNVAGHCPLILRTNKYLRCFDQDMDLLFKYIFGKNG